MNNHVSICQPECAFHALYDCLVIVPYKTCTQRSTALITYGHVAAYVARHLQ